jgi:hypothetical protein
MSLLDDVQTKVSQTWNDVSSTGGPAVIAGIENYAAQQLSQAAHENQTQAQSAVNQIVSQGGPSSGIMASINGVMGQIAQGAFFKEYGLYILGGAVVAYLVLRRAV